MISRKNYPRVNMPLRKIFVSVVRALMRMVARIHVLGLENMPDSGAVIVAANHTSYWDAPLAGPTVPRMCYVLTASKYEKHLFGLPMRIVGAIFIRRGEVDRTALRQILSVLEDQLIIVMAAEGTRSSTGGLQPGKDGVAYTAMKSGAPVLPMVIWGTYNILPAWKKLRRADVYIRFGEPFMLAEGRMNKANLDGGTEQVMIALANLLPEDYRGVYRSHPGVKPFSLDGLRR